MLINSEFASPTFTPFPLTPLDHLLPRLYMTCFPYFATKSPTEDALILKNGIEVLVAHNPILAGDVCPASSPDGKTNTLEVRPPTETSLKEYPLVRTHVHTREYFYRQKAIISHRVTGSILGQAKYRPIPLEAINQERAPALRWQINIFEDGIVVDVCFHHMFVDGMGVYILLKALAVCCRGLQHTRQISLQTVDMECRRKIIEMGERAENMPETKFVDIFPRAKTAPDPSREEVECQLVTVPFEVIGRLKEACQAITTDLLGFAAGEVEPELLNRSQAHPVFSDNDVAAALMWLCWARSRYHEKRFTSRPDETSIVMMVELRQKGILPPNYIGNALAPVPASAPLSSAVNSPAKDTNKESNRKPSDMYRQIPGLSTYDLALLAELTLRAYKAVVGVDKEYIQALIRKKQVSKDWQSYYPSEGQFVYSNMRLLNTMALDFGKALGNIARFDFPDFRTNGQCWVLPAPTRMAPWEFRMSMEREDMQRFLQDPLLVWAMGRDMARL
ncbi:uncharacterized protein BP01DRAFT_65129 [Aspergillus saccharolyticus JOP 1030-1]|uniref:O-acetyltransferase n=1 Tax=Aspergillus saccharolyticus JOP 1030-1 TaxID=1450539 RepID=A0A318ZEN6_9EURO|nr:hypothetical protein BP01DRAFT_65129 [Aspergillus saccharolyticus JOP 1030-1]PYH44734.1 hypothetical protein BP01DRAFT_65129 [Aspergillus saccharolyticus JOP 1030-1]